MILKTLSKIKQEDSKGIIVVPAWINQHWFPLFKTLLIDKPLIFKPNGNLLSMYREGTQTLMHVTLMAGIVSGQPS